MSPDRRSGLIAVGVFALVSALGGPGQAQTITAPTLTMAPVDQYLMDRNAEIALARTAAPAAVSGDAAVLVFGPHGYESAVKGKNGFVCLVERSWLLNYDDPAFFRADVRLPMCLNPPAVQSHMALNDRATQLALAGRNKTQMFESIKADYDKKALPLPAPGSMCFMLSKQQYFGPVYGNADPHLMFWFAQADRMTWGAGIPGSPIYVNQNAPDPITTFVISAPKWSDGTPSPTMEMH